MQAHPVDVENLLFSLLSSSPLLWLSIFSPLLQEEVSLMIAELGEYSKMSSGLILLFCSFSITIIFDFTLSRCADLMLGSWSPKQHPIWIPSRGVNPSQIRYRLDLFPQDLFFQVTNI